MLEALIFSRYYATYYVLVWSYDGLYDDDPVTAFAIWSVLLAWIYAHPMWFFRMIVVILQKWLLIGLDPWGGQNRVEEEWLLLGGQGFLKRCRCWSFRHRSSMLRPPARFVKFHPPIQTNSSGQSWYSYHAKFFSLSIGRRFPETEK